MLRIALTALTAALWSVTAAAQARPPAVRPENGLVVRYTVLGHLRTEPADPLALPTEFVERLAGEAHLARLEVGPQSGTLVTATFVFEDHETFRAWYASPATRDLLRLLTSRLSEPVYRLEVLRPALAGYLGPRPSG